MKTRHILLTAFAIFALAMLSSTAVQAQTCDGSGTNFIDLNGDGFNDNAPDHDGDGIPNGLDEDWVKQAQEGSGYQKGKNPDGGQSALAQHRTMTKTQQFTRLQAFSGNTYRNRVDAAGGMNGTGAGICDGTDGGGTGTGVCDGTGPKGAKKGGGK